MLPAYLPPAGRTELEETGEADRWSELIETSIDAFLSDTGLGSGNGGSAFSRTPLDESIALSVPVYWNAFPRRLLLAHGRERAMWLADRLWPMDTANNDSVPRVEGRFRGRSKDSWARPQDEYCEWWVQREPGTQRIRKIVFTCETEAYWTAIFGGRVGKVSFSGDRSLAARRYTAMLGLSVAPSDLEKPGQSAYDPFNPWNTSHGIVHLNNPFNSTYAAIRLCVSAMKLFEGPKGTPLTCPEALACEHGDLDPNRASDLAVLGTINALARQGARLSLSQQFGIYIRDVDTSGWDWPGHADARVLVTCDPGCAGLPTLRVVVEAPADETNYILDDLRIAGEPLTCGGQIAECITMAMELRADMGAKRDGEPVHTAKRQGYLRVASPLVLRTKTDALPTLYPGERGVFRVPPDPGRP